MSSSFSSDELHLIMPLPSASIIAAQLKLDEKSGYFAEKMKQAVSRISQSLKK
jgi:hypothetical protein